MSYYVSVTHKEYYTEVPVIEEFFVRVNWERYYTYIEHGKYFTEVDYTSYYTYVYTEGDVTANTYLVYENSDRFIFENGDKLIFE